jgi:hypothetical protein
MFCPQCKAEYRQGFTHCADCDVDLVWELPKGGIVARRKDRSGYDHDTVAGEPGDPNEDPFCSFWKGDDARVHAELCEVLDEAGIPHNTIFRRDHLFNLSNFPAYEVGVPFSMFERAENAVKEAYGTEDAEERETLNTPRLLKDGWRPIRKLPATLTPESDENIPGPPTAGEGLDWFPEDATVRIWSTKSGEPSDFLIAALHENSIRCRLDRNPPRAELYVLPEDEERARAIVHEVMEGQPPD